MPYLDFTTEDETTIKDKIDESLDLLREPPASTTSSGGTAGVDYDVADWPGTLVSGRVYYFRPHVDCQGGSNVKIKGIDARTEDGQHLTPEFFITNGVVAAQYTGSTLRLSPPKNERWHGLDDVSGGDSWVRVCRITKNSSNGFLHIMFVRGDIEVEKMDVFIGLNNSSISDTRILTKIIQTSNRFRHDGVGITSPLADTYDIYFAANGSSLVYEYKFVEAITGSDGEVDWNVEFFDNESADTEANITGGTFDVVSRPAEGELEKHQYEASNLDAAGEVTRLCRVTLPNASTTDSIGFRLLLHDVTRDSATAQDDWEAVISCRQNAAFSSDPDVSIATRALTTPIGLTHDKIHAFVADNSGPTLIDFYIEWETAETDWVFRVSDIALGDTDARIELFNSDGVSDEATVTGGSWDVSSQAARGEIVAEESFSIGGDFSATGYAKSVRGDGGNWVTVWVPDMLHTSNNNPQSQSGAVPSQYRPANFVQDLYMWDILSAPPSSAVVKRVTLAPSGAISYVYRNSSDSTNEDDTSTQSDITFGPYFIADP